MDLEKHYYFVVTREFALQNNGKKSKVAPDTFVASELPDGRLVCSVNSISSFPESFEHESFEVVALSSVDFEPKEVVEVPDNAFVQFVKNGANSIKTTINKVFGVKEKRTIAEINKENLEELYEGGDNYWIWLVGEIFLIIILTMALC